MAKRDREVKGGGAPTLEDAFKSLGIWDHMKARAVDNMRQLGINDVTADLEDAAEADVVVIKRTADGPPFAASTTTRCQRCNADCWLAEETEKVMPKDVSLICYPCVVAAATGPKQ